LRGCFGRCRPVKFAAATRVACFTCQKHKFFNSNLRFVNPRGVTFAAL